MDTEYNIQQRMLFVARDCVNIEKKGFNSYSNYAYVRAVDVVAEIGKLLVKHGVCLSILQEDLERTQIGKNFMSKVKCRAVFSNADRPTDQIVTTFYGVAADTLDKDLYKALTNGLKYLFTQQFLIVTDALTDAEDDRGKDLDVSSSSSKVSDPKNYVVGFGKFNGQRLAEIKPDDAINYAEYILSQAGTKPVAHKVQEFLDNVKALRGK